MVKQTGGLVHQLSTALRIRWVALFLVCWSSLCALPSKAAVVTLLELKMDGDVTRLLLEAPKGMLLDAGLVSSGDAIVLRLKDVDSRDLLTRSQKLANIPMFKNARILPHEGSETRLMVELQKPVTILDETILALPNQFSRWELVLGPADTKVAVSAVAPELNQIVLIRQDGRYDLALTGNSGLTVEASLQDSPPMLTADLQGVPLSQATAAAGRFRGDASLVKSVRAVAGANGSRLLFELSDTVDLVDTRGALVDGKGQVVMGLVPDMRSGKVGGGKLSALGFEVGHGLMQLRLDGVTGSRVSAYTIDSPPRLVVDFLGWQPSQVQEALSKFSVKSGATVGAPMLDTTRLGSARAVFDLAVSAPLKSARLVRMPVQSETDGYSDNMLIALSPGRMVNQAQVEPKRIDLSLRRELQEGRQSEVVVIRPTTLQDAGRFSNSLMQADRSADYKLMTLLAKSQEQDAKYLAAKAEYEAMKELVPQARAGYLPTASFDFQRSAVRQNVIVAANPTFPTGKVIYPNATKTLTITQALFKPQAWIKMDQSELAVNQAQLNLVAAEQDLILRVATGYLNLMAATDGVELARAEREATEKQYEEAKVRIESGLGTISQLHDTEARMALTRAREFEASNRIDDARLALKEIVGTDVDGISGFKTDFEASNPVPSAAEPWVEASLTQNLAIQGRALAVEIASLEVTRQRAGHLPTLALVGNLSRQDAGGSLYGNGMKNDNYDLGLRLSIPLTDGGLTSSVTREASVRRDKAAYEREQEIRRTERLARSSFNGVVTSAKTLTALRQSIVAQESALETRLEGYKSGLYNAVAVLDAYRLYYTAQRDFLQARYDYLLNRLKLRQAVGTLSRTDLEDIAALMQ